MLQTADLIWTAVKKSQISMATSHFPYQHTAVYIKQMAVWLMTGWKRTIATVSSQSLVGIFYAPLSYLHKQKLTQFHAVV